jgi:hypothetical protein
MGSAQSQTICPARGYSVAHPALKATVAISRAGSLNIMAYVLGGLERADAGVGAADGIARLGGSAPLPHGDPERGDESQSEATKESGLPSKPCEEGCGEPDHGVRPVRWSSIRAARALRA